MTARAAAAFSTAALDQVGLGLGSLDVGRARVRLDQLAGVEQLDVVLDLVLLRRAREDQRVPAVAQVLEQLARAFERLHLADQLFVVALLGFADLVTTALLGLVAGNRGHQLVAAHADVAVDAPDGGCQVVVAKRPVPGDRVVVVGVDEGAVEIEDRRGGHRHPPYPAQRR